MVSPFLLDEIDERSGTPLRSDVSRSFTAVLTLSTVLSFAVNAAKKKVLREKANLGGLGGGKESGWVQNCTKGRARERENKEEEKRGRERTRWDCGGLHGKILK